MYRRDEKIILCKHCGKPEYYGEMHWLNGRCSCRDCYKSQWQDENHKLYSWNNLDGHRPTIEELSNQEGRHIYRNKHTRRLYVLIEKVSDTESCYKSLEDKYTYTIPDKDMTDLSSLL